MHSVLEVPASRRRIRRQRGGAQVPRRGRRSGVQADSRVLEQQGIEASFVYKVGHAADQIARFATEGKFDVLVMGSRGHGELMNLVLGSVATQVLARCSTPVLLVR